MMNSHHEECQENHAISAIYDSIDVGDILQFIGNRQYLSANSFDSLEATPCKVKVVDKYIEDQEHPILVQSVNEYGYPTGQVYGLVDIKDLEMIHDPFLVGVTSDSLAYHTGPGENYKILGHITDKGIYTILQEKFGWGQLESKVGWIYLYGNTVRK